MSYKDVHPSNALSPIVMTVSGSTISFNAAQDENTSFPIVSNLQSSSNTNCSMYLQPLNASLLIEIIFADIYTSRRLSFSKQHSAAIIVTGLSL